MTASSEYPAGSESVGSSASAAPAAPETEAEGARPMRPLRPLGSAPLPTVPRLRRGVLVAAAGLVTVTLLAVAFLATPRPVGLAAAVPRPVTGGDPGFLQRPPAAAPAERPEVTEQEFLRRLLARGPEGAGRGAGAAAG